MRNCIDDGCLISVQQMYSESLQNPRKVSIKEVTSYQDDRW